MYFIQAISGPLKGKKFPVNKNLKLGRVDGDVILKDSLTSNPHAEIQLNPEGTIKLLDLNSKNGIFINGEKQKEALLDDNSQFLIGRSHFKVIFEESATEVWTKILEKASLRFNNVPKALSLFPKPLTIQFVSGPQNKQSVFLTYSPRVFGSASADIPLLEPHAPEQSFVLYTKENQVFFQTDHSKYVQLNNQSQPLKAVQKNDTVTIGNTKLKITF